MLFADSRTPRRVSRLSTTSGFTLIELLMVMVVVAILSAILFGISTGVRNSQNKARAKADLAVIAQALEQFKLKYGDFPWHDSNVGAYPSYSGDDPDVSTGDENKTNTMLLYALTGRLSMERQPDGSIGVELISDDLDNDEVIRRPSFIDASKLSVEYAKLADGEDDLNRPYLILDPWGQPYKYWYKWENTENNSPTPVWEVFGYHLFSKGDDRLEDTTFINANTGAIQPAYKDAEENLDNIFIGE